MRIRDYDSDVRFIAYTSRACASEGVWIKRYVVRFMHEAII